MAKVDNITLLDRVEVYHLEALYSVQRSSAYSRMNKMLDFFNRRSRLLYIKDVAIYDGYEREAKQEEFLKDFKIRLKKYLGKDG